MTAAAVHAFDRDGPAARRLARALGAAFAPIGLHRFPDGESSVSAAPAAAVSCLYSALNRPDAKLAPLLLAADALRRRGADRLILVAPYLPYLRQDRVFVPGQALSRDVFGRAVGSAFDGIITVQAHMHRTRDLDAALGGRPVLNLSAVTLLAQAGRWNDPVFVAPDIEAESWARAAADAAGGTWTGFRKVRDGDREVRLGPARVDAVRGRQAVILDDICSSGATLMSAAASLRAAGAAGVDVAVAHALFPPVVQARLLGAGIGRILSTDSIPHPTNAARLAPLLAQALSPELTP